MIGMQTGKPFPDREVIDLCEIRFAPPGFCFYIFRGAEKTKKLRQVAFIIAQRMNTDVSFVTQMIQELREITVKHSRRLQFAIIRNLMKPRWTFMIRGS